MLGSYAKSSKHLTSMREKEQTPSREFFNRSVVRQPATHEQEEEAAKGSQQAVRVKEATAAYASQLFASAAARFHPSPASITRGARAQELTVSDLNFVNSLLSSD